jgi:peptide/nickel transport system permease protein
MTAVAATGEGRTDRNRQTLLRRCWRGLRTSPKALVSAFVLVFLLLVALAGPYVTPQDPYDLMQIDIFDARLPPGSESMSGSVFWLGTDSQGRDMVSAMVYGLRSSLLVGVSSGVVALMLGTFVGLVAAYVGGRLDSAIMRVVDLMLGLPTILVALMMLALLGQGVWKVILALVLVQWAYFARAVRASALIEKGKEYVEAAVGLGFGPIRILLGQILPNCLPPVIVIGTLQVANAISAEATLSFLGIGVQEPQPTWGGMIRDGLPALRTDPYLALYASAALGITIIGFNLLGDGLRDILDPRIRDR